MAAEPQSFTASFDSTTQGVSIAIFVLLAFGVVVTRSSKIAGIEAGVLFFAWACSTRGYIVLDHAIIVKRPIGKVRLSIDALSSIRLAEPEDTRNSIRLFGSGGLFGYYGIFRNAKLGKSHWYLTSRNRIVIVFTQDKTALLSPDDIDSFLSALRATNPDAQFPEIMSTADG